MHVVELRAKETSWGGTEGEEQARPHTVGISADSEVPRWGGDRQKDDGADAGGACAHV